jgi:hypothetical protein
MDKHGHTLKCRKITHTLTSLLYCIPLNTNKHKADFNITVFVEIIIVEENMSKLIAKLLLVHRILSGDSNSLLVFHDIFEVGKYVL